MQNKKLKNRYLKKQNDLSAKSVYPPFPRIVKIDVCNTCNYRCVFCPQSKQHNKIGCIDSELCRRIIKDSYEAGARELCLSMTGEPLLNPDLESFTAYAKELGYTYVFFNTNGYLLNRERSARLLQAGIDSIKVSLNSGRKSYSLIHGMDAFEQVLENVKIFDELRGGGQCALYLSYVAVKQTLEEVNEVKELLSSYVDDIIVMNANGRGGSVFDSTSGLYIDEDEYSFTYPCSQLFNNVYITSEGYMVICCQDFENLTVVADLHEETVAEAWTNQKFTAFRKRYLEHDLKGTLCQNCIYNTSEEVIPLTEDKAYYDTSKMKEKDLLHRINELIRIGEKADG